MQGTSPHCAGTVARPNGQELAQEFRAARVGQHCGKLALDAFEFRCDPALPQRGIAGALYRRVQGALAFAQPRHPEFDIAEQTPEPRPMEIFDGPPRVALPAVPTLMHRCLELPGDDFTLKLRQQLFALGQAEPQRR